MKESKCAIKGDDNTVIQNTAQSDDCEEKKPNTWTDPAVTILCIFNFLLGAAVYKWILWRWP